MGKKRRRGRSKRSKDEDGDDYPHRSATILDDDDDVHRSPMNPNPNPLESATYEPPSTDLAPDPEPVQRTPQQTSQRSDTPIPPDIEQRNWGSEMRSYHVQRVEAGKPAGETQVPESVRDVISSPGQSLDPSIQRAMEDRMGDSFGDVQIHTGPQAARACEDIDARAFTVGNHIAFNHGEYDPSSADGQHLIAHELAHVRQQTGGAVSMMPKSDADLEIDPDPELEREADEAAKQALSDGPITINRMGTDIHVQRSVKDKIPGLSGGSDGGGPGNLQDEVEELARQVEWVKQNAVMQDQLAGSGLEHDVSGEEAIETTKAIEEAKAAGNGQRESGKLGWLADHVPDAVTGFFKNAGVESATRGLAFGSAVGLVGLSSGGFAFPAAMAGTMALSKGLERTVTSIPDQEVERIKDRVITEIEGVDTVDDDDPYNGGE